GGGGGGGRNECSFRPFQRVGEATPTGFMPAFCNSALIVGMSLLWISCQAASRESSAFSVSPTSAMTREVGFASAPSTIPKSVEKERFKRPNDGAATSSGPPAP